MKPVAGVLPGAAPGSLRWLQVRCGTLCLGLVLLAGTGQAGAQRPSAPLPGEYLTEGAAARLDIVDAKDGRLQFTLESISGQQQCRLAGIIGKGQSTAVVGPEPGACVVGFQRRRGGVDVTQVSGDCQRYCPASATFIGVYLRPGEGCTAEGRQRTQAEYRRRFERDDVSGARDRLLWLLERCGRTLTRAEAGQVRNDLAAAYLRLKDRAACRKVLAPYRTDAARSDAQLRADPASADMDFYLPIVQAARITLESCAEKRR